MYAELTGNCEKHGIKSLCGNKIVMEGRIIYDAFVLNKKKSAIYYHGAAISTTAKAEIAGG